MRASHKLLGDIRGYNLFFDPYCAHLEELLTKIMWSTFFDHTFDFYMAFSKFKRPLTLVASYFLVFSYLHHFEMHAAIYNKLLRALTTSKWVGLILNGRSD